MIQKLSKENKANQGNTSVVEPIPYNPYSIQSLQNSIGNQDTCWLLSDDPAVSDFRYTNDEGKNKRTDTLKNDQDSINNVKKNECGVPDKIGEVALNIDLNYNLTIGSWQFPGNDEGIRKTLEDYILKNGIDQSKIFVQEINDNIRYDKLRYNLMFPKENNKENDNTNEKKARLKLKYEKTIAIKWKIVDEFNRILSFMTLFEDSARIVGIRMLDLSEKRLKDEKVRYGIKEEEKETLGFKSTSYSMKPNKNNTELMAVAKSIKSYKDNIPYLESAVTNIRNDLRLKNGNPRAYEMKLNTATDRLQKAKSNYLDLRLKGAEKFPILAETLNEKGSDVLSSIATNNYEEAAEGIGSDIQDKQNNINKFRDMLSQKKLDVWTLPVLLENTMDFMKLPPKSFERKMIQQKLDKVRLDKYYMDLLKELVGILLFFNPYGKVAGVALRTAKTAFAVYQGYQSVHEYWFNKKLNNTDYDQAYMLVNEDPSLLWLLVDLYFVYGDVKDGVKIAKAQYNDIVAQRKLFITERVRSQTRKEAARAERKLLELIVVGNQIKGGLGDDLLDEIRETMINVYHITISADLGKELSEKSDYPISEISQSVQGKVNTELDSKLKKASPSVDPRILVQLIGNEAHQSDLKFVVDFYDPVTKEQYKVEIFPEYVPAVILGADNKNLPAKNINEAVLIADSRFSMNKENMVVLTNQLRALMVLAKRHQLPFVFLLRNGGAISKDVEHFANAIGVQYLVQTK